MRIKSLTLKPFAGITDKKVDFSPGLNVILGPNETGKSTLLNALKSILFTEVNLTKSKYDKLIKEYMPAQGGNTVRVYLDFQKDGKEYLIEKVWKAGSRDGSCLFRIEDKSEYTGDSEVSELISQFLPAQEGTIRNILLTWQSALSRTMNVLDAEGKEVRSDLGTILRSSIMETDGISIDRLKEKLDREYEETFQHWNIEREEPENGRGINNPYKKGVGKILAAYYEKENIRKSYDESIEIEKEIDELNRIIQEKEEEKNNIQGELEKYEPIKSQIFERQQIDSELVQIDGKIREIKTISKEWPIKENWLLHVAESEIKNIESEKNNLKEEETASRKNQESKDFRLYFERIQQLHKKLEESKKKLSEAKEVTGNDIELLRKKRQEIQNLENKILASKLKFSFIAKIAQEINIKDTAGQKESYFLKKDEKIEKTLQGKLFLEHRDWSLEVQSGEGEIDTLISDKEKFIKEFNHELEKIGIDHFEDARSINKKYERLKGDVERAENNFQDELQGKVYKDLEDKFKQLGEEIAVRPLEEIVADQVLLNVQFENHKNKKEETEKQIKIWEELYTSHDHLISMLGDEQYKHNKLKTKLENLPRLPDEFKDYKDFFDSIESLKERERKYQDEISELRVKKITIENQKPELSSEELIVMVSDSEQNFQRVCLEGKGLSLIRDKSNELLERIGMNTYGEFQDRFRKYFLKMSGNSFSGIEMENDYPKKLMKSNGAELTYHLLSFGTKDTFSLALRLTMAEYFLQDKEGFLILDDPLVDMDLDRQALAAEQINEFAKNRQVIFLTCHAHTAQLLKGNCITL